MSSDPQQTGERPPAPSGRYPAYPPPYDDELSLANLVRALGRRWRWVAGCALLALLLAALFVVARTPQFAHTATLRLGSLPLIADTEERAALPIDTPANVVAELERYYLPRAARATGHDVRVAVARVAGSDLVELTAEAPAARTDAVVAVMQHALARLVADHRQALAGHLNQRRARAGQDGGPGPDGAPSGASAATREALERAIELLATPLDGDVAETHARAESMLQSTDPLLRPTRIVAPPARAGGPVGLSPAIIVVLALVLGLGAGVVLALLVDAVRRDMAPR